jgi:DNA modification methylase
MTEINKVYHGDWMSNKLADKSVQLIIADPPYFEVKGDFDFVWKSFADYLIDVEKWAIECKRLLADNGTLFWYGHAKKIAYAQVIFDKLLCLENNIAIEFNRQTKKGVEEFRCFAPVSERLLMYSTGNDYHDNVRLAIKYIQDYLNTITNRDELAKILLETGNCRNFESAKQNANNILSQKSAKPQMITQFQYDLIPNKDKKDYEILKQEYEALRVEHEELRRPFNNFKKLFDIMSFDQEAHITSKYEHDTCKPETLTRALILTCSRPNDLVLVPFAGSGTECAMALREKRNFIGFDTELKYVEMANNRCMEISKTPSLF